MADNHALLRSFLKMISTGPGGTVTNYSPRFSLTGMKGTFPAAVLAGIQKVSGTDGPPTEKMGGNLPKTGVNAPSESFAIPFASQTGAIFYAPMQKRPGTKITAKDAKPLYPTSSVTLATGFLPTPKQTTTFTATMTISTESRAHTVRRSTRLSALDLWTNKCFRHLQPHNQKTICRSFWNVGETDGMGHHIAQRIPSCKL